MITVDEMKEDWDWQAAFHTAINGSYVGYDDQGPVENVTRVIAAAEGENDGDEWVAIVEWGGPEGSFAVMSAWCDYTGWG